MLKFDLSVTASLTLYALLCGFSYLAGFWSNFPIGIRDIIYFTSTTDILKSAIVPIIAVVLGMLFLLNFFKIDWHSKLSLNTLHYNTKFKYQIILIIVAVLIISGCLAYNHWILLGIDKTASTGVTYAFGASFAISLALCVFNSLLPNLNFFYRAFFIFIICFFPTFIACWGMESGNQLSKGVGSFLIQDSGECSKHTKEPFRYIATYGDNTFSYSHKDNLICIQKDVIIILVPEMAGK
ncbi:hypothetical protein EJP80_12755 [Rahnella aquatilis]|nr:hypothetical protein EJP80_12755 [Rahnella aquatilis]